MLVGAIKLPLLVILLTAALQAQVPAPVVLKAETREVLVEVTVTDSKGAPVTNLTKDDFALTDNGKPRVIEGISTNHDYRAISALPGTLHLANGGSGPNSTAPAAIGHSSAIILDEVNTFFEDAAQARAYVHDLLQKVPPDERIALYAIVRRKGLVLLQDYTTDRDLLRIAIAQYRPGNMLPTPDIGNRFDQPMPPYSARPATRDEALEMWHRNSDDVRLSFQSLAEQLALIPGRKSIFWITNALPPAIMKELSLDIGWDKTTAALNKANVAVNAIDSRGLYRGSNPVTGTIGTMIKISEATGGKAYYNRNDLDGAIAEGITAARASYTLRFHLGDDERDNIFHTLKVTVPTRPGLELFYRKGYDSGGNPASGDLLAARIDGQSLEIRAATTDTPTLKPSAQLSWFYTGKDQANVILSMDLPDDAGLHGPIEVLGIASLPAGGDAARFSDTVNLKQADTSAHTPWHYQHQFTVAAGTYIFRLTIGAGPDAFGKLELPLTVDPWNGATFTIASLALSTEARAINSFSSLDALDPEAHTPLTLAGKQFVPVSAASFPKPEHLYLYTELTDPALATSKPPTVKVQIRLLDKSTGDVKLDTGMAGIPAYVHAGNQLIPFATSLPISPLSPGPYRLEVRASHSSGPDSPVRSLDFELE